VSGAQAAADAIKTGRNDAAKSILPMSLSQIAAIVGSAALLRARESGR